MPPKRAKTTANFWPNVMQPRQDSNLDQAFRKRLFYPLNYGAVLHALRHCRGRKDATICSLVA